MNSSALAERVVGHYPLSIATSLAIEGAMGIHPDKPDQKQVLLPKYDVIWVNLKTIFRNMYNAVERTVVLDVPHDAWVEAFYSEVDQFMRVIASETASKMQVVLYVSDYAGMPMTYRHAILRGDNTGLQLAYTKTLLATLTPFIKANREMIKTYKLKITDKEPRKALILTHYAFDLLSKEFSNLSLLESHTGTIKEKHQWYTKYLNGKDHPNIPFREDFMQVFGDSEHFRPMSIGIRKQVLALADKYNWSQITTTDKINYCLDTLQDRPLRDMLKAL